MSLKKLYYLLLSFLFSLGLLACGNSQETISYSEIEYEESGEDIVPTVLTGSTEENSSASLDALDNEVSKEETKKLYISVLGEVIEPGVYILPEGSRVYEAINMAGGVTEQANVYSLNLVMELEDGVQIVVPSLDEEGDVIGFGLTENTQPEDEGKVNVNKAGLAELKTLTGIGDVRAQAIIDFREKNGAFNELEDLMKVNGIKESTYEKFKDEICLK